MPKQAALYCRSSKDRSAISIQAQRHELLALAKTRDLTVTGYSPRQPIDDLEPIEIQFDQPVVSEVEVGGAASADAVTITPALRWTGHWRGSTHRHRRRRRLHNHRTLMCICCRVRVLPALNVGPECRCRICFMFCSVKAVRRQF